MRVTVVATFEAVEGRRDELAALVAGTAPAVRAEPGCLGWEPHTVGRDRVLVVEGWDGVESLTAHGAGPVLAGLTAAAADLLAREVDVVVARPLAVTGVVGDAAADPGSRA